MPAASEPQTRDPRLDFFRGLGMFIILIAHIPYNSWTDWIPARFGFSDAADMFVFCSGMASALAFGKLYDRQGWAIGSLRIMQRVWQVYWAHIGVVLAVLALAIWADGALGVDHYVREELKLQPLLDQPRASLFGLVTLRYVPNSFDILPMYLVILAMVPIVMGVAAFSRIAVAGLVIALWILANLDVLQLTAEPLSGRPWFFNPFAWQLLFFTGFAFMRGWLPLPPRDGRLLLAASLIVVLAIPIACQPGFACHGGFGWFPLLGDIQQSLGWLTAKTNLGPLRVVHFIATAYLAYIAVGPVGERLTGTAVDLTRRVGQQTLAVFLAGLVIAQALGIGLDLLGRTMATTAIANLLGLAGLVVVALVTAAFKAPPWRKQPLPPVSDSATKATTPSNQIAARSRPHPALRQDLPLGQDLPLRQDKDVA